MDNVSGSDDITLILTDKDGGIYKKSDISINIDSTLNLVSISIPSESIEIEQGKFKNITLIITNVGKIKENYTISFEYDEFTIADIQLSKSSFSLKAGENAQVIVIISVPEDMKKGEYKIKFIVKSDTASDNTTLTINVKEKEIEDKSGNPMLFIGIVIVIILLVLILLFKLVFKKKPQQKDGETKEDNNNQKEE